MIRQVLQIGFSLLVVFGLMWLLARLAKRPMGGNRGAGALSVLGRQQLSRGSSVAVIRVADRALVLGVSDQHVSMLAEADLESFEEYAHHGHHGHHGERREPAMDDLLSTGTVQHSKSWRSVMEYLRDRTVRQ